MNLKKLFLILLFSGVIITMFYITLNYFIKKQNFETSINKLKKLSDTLNIKKINKINVPVYYINLDRSEKRRSFMEEQFKKFNIFNFKRIEAVDGKKLKKEHDTVDNITFTNNYNKLTKNELGCLLSHLKAIKTAYDNGLDKVLILEDDCSLELMVFWKDNLMNIINNLNKPDWEIFQLFNANCIDFTSKNCTLKKDTKDCWGNVAYIINRKGMEKIINTVKSSNHNEIILGKKNNNKIFPRRGQADIFIYQIAKTYYLDTPLFFTNNSNSFLKSTIALTNDRDNYNNNISQQIVTHYIQDFVQKKYIIY